MSITMTKVFESAMTHPFDLTDMLGKINTHHIMGNLEDAERDALIDLARSKANPSGSLDVMAKLQELDSRVRALEEAKKAEGSATPDAGTDAPEEYVPGKWYRNGDRITWKGNVYVCANVPDGHVCTWNPDEYPAYWYAE